MLEIFRLIRIPNLLMIALTQVLIHNCLIIPAFRAEYFVSGNFPNHLSDLNLILLIISTLLISAAGYIINDFFDIHIDEVNKPGRNTVGKSISARWAKNMYFLLSLLGVVLGFYVALQIRKPVMGLIPLFAAGSLWMYSSFYKRRLFSGNIIVACLCALSLLIVGLYEPEFYPNISYLLWFVIPAFFFTLIRELIKDIEDIEGDELSQCKTAPIVLGISVTKRIILGLLILVSAYLVYVLYTNFYKNQVISFWYMVGLLLIPIFGLAYLVVTARQKKDFHYASVFSKILMTGGILTIYLFWFYFLR